MFPEDRDERSTAEQEYSYSLQDIRRTAHQLEARLRVVVQVTARLQEEYRDGTYCPTRAPLTAVMRWAEPEIATMSHQILRLNQMLLGLTEA